VPVDDRDRIGIRQRALGGTERLGPSSHRGRDEVSADGVRVVRGYLDAHRVATLSSGCSRRIRSGRRPNSTRERHPMAWIKPEFEFIEMCSEVTSYLYKR